MEQQVSDAGYQGKPGGELAPIDIMDRAKRLKELKDS